MIARALLAALVLCAAGAVPAQETAAPAPSSAATPSPTARDRWEKFSSAEKDALR
ncbi:MAG: hypothetical protein H6Q88_2664, partial [Anaeromyxobacteraceae bacterium]|nr:hypothetical protein [Anaeromyxobacteraceae bacterium]